MHAPYFHQAHGACSRDDPQPEGKPLVDGGLVAEPSGDITILIITYNNQLNREGPAVPIFEPSTLGHRIGSHLLVKMCDDRSARAEYQNCLRRSRPMLFDKAPGKTMEEFQ